VCSMSRTDVFDAVLFWILELSHGVVKVHLLVIAVGIIGENVELFRKFGEEI